MLPNPEVAAGDLLQMIPIRSLSAIYVHKTLGRHCSKTYYVYRPNQIHVL